MESQTKAKLTEEQLDRLIGKHFGESTSVVHRTELTNGWFNTAYDLALSSGENVILKVAPGAEVETLTCEKNIMKNEVEVLKLVRKEGAIPVPNVYAYDDSQDLIPHEYFLMEKVHGQPYNLIKESMSADERERIEVDLGRYNRKINEIRGDSFGHFVASPEKLFASWGQVFAALMADLLTDGRRLGVQLPASYEEIEEAVAAKLPFLDEVTEPRLVHWDLWNGNVFVHEGRIHAIIDWERALWGDPLFEYYFGKMEPSEAFYRGYGNRFDSQHERERRKLYDLYFDLILVIECYSRKYENPDHVRWVRKNLAAGWVQFQD